MTYHMSWTHLLLQYFMCAQISLRICTIGSESLQETLQAVQDSSVLTCLQADGEGSDQTGWSQCTLGAYEICVGCFASLWFQACILSVWVYKLLITKTYLYNFDPLKPHFCIVKLGFTGVYIIFLLSAQKHRLWVLVRTASAVLRSTHNLCFEQKYENIRIFYLNIFIFWW